MSGEGAPGEGAPGLSEQDRLLVARAREAASAAYAPFSGFSVGAALRTRSGVIVPGCNVENASFGLTICAERNAMTSAVAAGLRDVVAVAIYTPSEEAGVPCGACRQFLAEFNASMQVFLACDGEAVRVTTLADLLPDPFLGTALDGSSSGGGRST